MANSKIKEKLIKAGGISLAFVIGGILAWWICSRMKDKVYTDLQGKHDEDTSKRLSESFAEELKKIIVLYESIIKKKNEETTEKTRQEREAIISLCIKYGLSENIKEELLKKLRL